MLFRSKADGTPAVANRPARSVLCADCDQHAPLKSIASVHGPMKLRNMAKLKTPSATPRPSAQTLEFEVNITSLLFKKRPIGVNDYTTAKLTLQLSTLRLSSQYADTSLISALGACDGRAVNQMNLIFSAGSLALLLVNDPNRPDVKQHHILDSRL